MLNTLNILIKLFVGVCREVTSLLLILRGAMLTLLFSHYDFQVAFLMAKLLGRGEG